MKSKIEKLEYNYLLDGSIKTAPHPLDITEKINEIIDYLNSQDQEEGTLKELEDNYLCSLRTANKPMSQNTPKGWIDEVTKVEIKDTPEDTEHIKAHKEYLATSKQDTLGGKTLSDRIASAKPNSFIPVTEEEMKQLSNTQDTPEEWEKKISTLVKEGLFEEVTDDKGERVLGYIGCSDKVLKEIKQLLDDREKEVLENMRDWVVEYTLGNYKVRDFDAEIAIGKIIDRELDKLNSKKK